MLQQAGLTAEHVAAARRILALAALDEAAALLGGPSPALERLRALFRLLEAYGVGAWARFDIAVIRGLGYYTGIVFEAFDTARSLRAIFGGGRYDNLLGDIGGRPQTAVGLGFGDVVIGELLAARGKSPAAGEARQFAVGFMEDAQHPTGVTLARALRGAGYNVDLTLHPEKPKAFFARVGKAAFRHAIYLGPDEIRSGTIRVKDLARRTEREVRLDAALAAPSALAPAP
jgi:histidyl-tRNA synthetase